MEHSPVGNRKRRTEWCPKGARFFLTLTRGQNTFNSDISSLSTGSKDPRFGRMTRVLLILTAVVIAVLAFVLEQPWLYVAAGVPLLGVLALLGRTLRDVVRRRKWRQSSDSVGPADASLEDLGITDVRPHEREGAGNGAAAAENDERPTDGMGTGAAPGGGEASSIDSSSDGDVETRVEREASEAVSDSSPRLFVADPPDHPIIDPALESLRAAVDAETACLLVQEDVVLEYEIAGMASSQSSVQTSGTFESPSPLLTASMSRQSVTVQSFGPEETPDGLAYYDDPPSIRERALIPVPRPDSASSVFILVDSAEQGGLDTSRDRALLQQFMETIRLLRDPDDPQTIPATDETETAEASRESGGTVGDRKTRPRPRREIIHEEMQAADAGDDELALVLVHLNRAESIARRGAEAVSSAERRLRTRLEHFAAGQRVERFGELTYGIFPRHGVQEVESWAAELQDVMAQETGELEGGVSVGVAVRRPRHDAEGLRADATEALREAYETGTCTVVA